MKKRKVSSYKVAKEYLEKIAKNAKKNHPNDKPQIRQVINDGVDWLSKDYKLTDYQRDLLANHACKLHPKN